MAAKLDVGGTLSEVFRIYRDQAGLLLPLAFWLYLVAAIVDAVVGNDFSVFWVGIVVTTVISTLYQGMVVGLVGDIQDGRRDWSMGDLVRSILPVLAPLVGAGILAGFGIGFGLVLFLVPGLYLLTIWSVFAPAIVLERRSVFDAFGRSRALVRDHGWQVLAVVLVAFLIGISAGIVASAIAAAVANGIILHVVLGTLASTITAPIAGLVAAVLYFRLRELKGEGRAVPASGEPPSVA